MITEMELQTALQSFVGQEYKDWSTASNIFSAVRQLLEKDGVNTNNIYYDKDHQTIKVTYKKFNLLEVTVAKTKGKKHYGYHYNSSWCDWTVKSVTVFVLNPEHDIAKRMAEIDGIVIARKQAADLKLQEAISAVKAIKSAMPTKSKYELEDLIKYMADNRYTIFSKIN